MKRLLKRLSLQWRITLLTILLLATACVTMKTLLCSSGHAYMDSIGNYVMHYVQEDPQAVRVDIPDEQWKDLSERFNGEFVLELSGAKHSFCIRGWYIALAVTALGGAVAYFVSGKALKPLKRFTAKAERVQLQSLTEITLSEDEAVEFSRLSRAINQMLLRLNQAFDAQQQFVGNAAHELRTPLTAINGWGETILEDTTDDPAQMRRGIRIILNEARRLSTMVEELLEFSKMEDGRFTLRMEQVDLQAEFEDAIFTYREIFSREGIELRYECADDLPPIIADGERMKQVFCNVLDNAAKHGGSGKRIDVSVAAENGSMVIRVRDFGPGIPVEELPYVKQKFYKGSSKARGSGIGLAVCDEIMRLHNGTFDIANASGGGAVVTMTLPMEK